jgi:hypothetical protein
MWTEIRMAAALVATFLVGTTALGYAQGAVGGPAGAGSTGTAPGNSGTLGSDSSTTGTTPGTSGGSIGDQSTGRGTGRAGGSSTGTTGTGSTTGPSGTR